MKHLKSKIFVGIAALVFAVSAGAQLIYGNNFPFWTVSGPLVVTGTSTLSGGLALTGTTTIGAGATLTAPTIAAYTMTGTGTIGNGATITTPVIANPNITGTTTNDAAAAGSVGELLTANVTSGAPVTGAATTVAVNITSLSLTAGDWDVSAHCNYALTGVTATVYSCGLGTTTGVQLSAAGGGGVGTDPLTQQAATFGTTITGTQSQKVGPVRVTLASTTTIFLVTNNTFSAGTYNTYGTLRARRMR